MSAAITVTHGLRVSVLTGEHKSGEPGTVSVTTGKDGRVLVVVGVRREEPHPRLMLDLTPAEKRLLILALENTP